MDLKKEEGKARRPQVGVSFDEETFARLGRDKERYKKRDLALIVYEIVVTYLDKYEEAEESKLATLVEQGAREYTALGKAPAPATARRARKTA